MVRGEKQSPMYRKWRGALTVVSLERLSQLILSLSPTKSSAVCLSWQTAPSSSVPPPSAQEVIVSCQAEGGRSEADELPESGTHKGPFQPHKDSVIEHNNAHRDYQSILAVRELKCTVNVSPPPPFDRFLIKYSFIYSVAATERCGSLFSFCIIITGLRDIN